MGDPCGSPRQSMQAPGCGLWRTHLPQSLIESAHIVAPENKGLAGFELLGWVPKPPGPDIPAQPAGPFRYLQPRPESLRRNFATREAWACSNHQADALGRVLQPGIRTAVDRALWREAQGAFAPRHR